MKKLLFMLCIIFGMALSAHSKEIVLTEDNTLILNEEFSQESITELMEKATKMDSKLKSGYPMYLFLNTPGGSIQAGLELYEFFGGLNREVHTITLFAASMGFQTVQHLGKRYVLKYGVLMSHKARGGFTGEFGGGLSQLDSRFGLWLRRINLMDEKTVSRTNKKQTLKSYRASYDNELWLNGEEAVKQGYADEVVTIKCDASLNTPVTKEFSMGFYSVTVTFSGCPIKTSPLSVSASIVTNKGRVSLEEFIVGGGKFGANCQESDIPAHADHWGKQVLSQKADLCASDKELTLGKIKQEIEAKSKFLSRNLQTHVQYSY